MKVLSLFDGMACGMLAMQKVGIAVDEYIAYEIDKYAIQTATHNFPMIKECGDVFKADFSQYKDIDYIVGGSPCTYWSIAQKNNRETEASGLGWELFSQYVRAINEVKPKYFIYENNKSMSQAIRESISSTFGFEPICINSSLVSAQNRQRLYWVGKRNADGTYSKVDVQQPEDKGIVLRDILGIAEPVNITENGKSQTLKAQYNKNSATNFCCYSSTYGATGVAEPVCVAQRGRYEDTGSRNVKGSGPIRVGALPRPNGELSTSQAMRVYSVDGKSVNLVSGGGGMGGKTGLYAIPVEFDNDIPIKAISAADGKTCPVYKDKQYPIKLADGYYIIRKLTVTECKRLQTVPETYSFPVSNNQAYKMLGNGWTVDVIAHILKGCV